jgi:hypothetical protein
MSNLTPTPIVDKNGKQTTVHKRADDGRSAARAGSVAISAASAPIQDDSTGTFEDGTSYTLEGTAEIVKHEYPHVNSQVNEVSRVFFSLDKGDSIRFDVNKDNFSSPYAAPDYKIAERDSDGVFTAFAGYKVDIDYLTSGIDNNFADSESGKRAVLEGFIRGKFGGVIVPENESGDEFSIIVPTQSQPHDVVDRPIEYESEGLVGLYAPAEHAYRQESIDFARQVTGGHLADTIRNAFSVSSRGYSF